MNFKKSILSVLLITQFFVNCKGDAAHELSEKRNKNDDLNTEKLDTLDVRATSATQWIYIKSVPIVASGAKNSVSCDDKKYGELNIRIQNDSVFLFDTYTDKVNTGKVKSKDFFKEKYLYDFYKKMLRDEVKINLGETLDYARNTRAYSKDSKLDAYFRDAFFIDQFMFIESNGCVYIYKKNADVKGEAIDKTSSKVASKKIVELPFDFADYYNSCIYPSDKSCSSKFPSTEFKNDGFLKTVETAIGIPEPAVYFELPSVTKEVAVYIVAYQGNDNDSYHLISVKNGKVISKLEIGSMDGTTLNDFVITKDNLVNLYTRENANGKRKTKGIYKISSTGKFESQR